MTSWSVIFVVLWTSKVVGTGSAYCRYVVASKKAREENVKLSFVVVIVSHRRPLLKGRVGCAGVVLVCGVATRRVGLAMVVAEIAILHPSIVSSRYRSVLRLSYTHLRPLVAQ